LVKAREAFNAETVQAVRRAVADSIDPLLINKFWNMEAQGRGLSAEIAKADYTSLTWPI
jgi:hypothetical protein